MQIHSIITEQVRTTGVKLQNRHQMKHIYTTIIGV